MGFVFVGFWGFGALSFGVLGYGVGVLGVWGFGIFGCFGVKNDFLGFSDNTFLKQLCYCINGHQDTFIRVDMILNCIFRLGLRGHVLIEASTIPRTFARGARKRSRDLSCFYKYMSSKSKTNYVV